MNEGSKFHHKESVPIMEHIVYGKCNFRFFQFYIYNIHSLRFLILNWSFMFVTDYNFSLLKKFVTKKIIFHDMFIHLRVYHLS